ncbi:hypothetical protein [Paenibacillus tyrfis]|uniref:hypothetical protein n=1 Tax=Paenibacillus tyrfis TaxID=1501230 RepID=UPI00209E7A66|nr:hypothetical protein [Paenibacillus tyrfis]MCP1311773.1 hypothetical protein [Paenibacillus tyrfis]
MNLGWLFVIQGFLLVGTLKPGDPSVVAKQRRNPGSYNDRQCTIFGAGRRAASGCVAAAACARVSDDGLTTRPGLLLKTFEDFEIVINSLYLLNISKSFKSF